MESFYARLIAPTSQTDALLIRLASLMQLDRTQVQRMSGRFAWNGW
jgi:hypothetical protein